MNQKQPLCTPEEKEELFKLCASLNKKNPKEGSSALIYFKIGEWLYNRAQKMPVNTSRKDLYKALPENINLSYEMICNALKIFYAFRDDQSERLANLTVYKVLKMLPSSKKEIEQQKECSEEIKEEKDLDVIVGRIKNVKAELGYTNKGLEEKLELANGYINDIERGKNKNPSKLVMALYDKFRISPNYLLVGKGSMFLPNGKQTELPAQKGVTIPLLSQKVSCGPGKSWENEQNITEYISVASLSPALSGKVYGFRVSGTSMLGAGIKDGDIVIFDASPNQELTDGIYVFSLDGDAYCKRLEFDRLANLIKIYSVRVADLEKAELLRTLNSTDEGFAERFNLFGRVFSWLHLNRD